LTKDKCRKLCRRTLRDCAIITWREGVWKIIGGLGEMTTRDRRGCKFNTYRGGRNYLFIPF